MRDLPWNKQGEAANSFVECEIDAFEMLVYLDSTIVLRIILQFSCKDWLYNVNISSFATLFGRPEA